jgi:hypothetical protein
MLGSNQRPLPCEVRSVMSWLFAGVQKYLQISTFLLRSYRPCSSLFAGVGVLIGVIAAEHTLWRSLLGHPIAGLLRDHTEEDFTSAADAS